MQSVFMPTYKPNAMERDLDGPQRRLALVETNAEHIEKTYLSGVAKGYDDPIVLILDTNDPLAHAIASANEHKPEYVEYFTKEIQAQPDTIPTLWMTMPRWTAYKFFRQLQRDVIHMKDSNHNPKVSKGVELLKENAEAGRFWVLVISMGKLVATALIPTKSV
jgi:hypothetical protein